MYVNLQSNDGFPPLAAVSHEGHTNCVELLVQRGVGVDACNKDGRTQLYWAARNGHIEIVVSDTTRR